MVGETEDVCFAVTVEVAQAQLVDLQARCLEGNPRRSAAGRVIPLMSVGTEYVRLTVTVEVTEAVILHGDIRAGGKLCKGSCATDRDQPLSPSWVKTSVFPSPLKSPRAS